MDKPEDAANIINEYEEILHTKRKSIITVAYHQGKVFSQFSEKEKFVMLVENFKIHKGTIIFQISVSKLMKKYPRLKKSSVILSFLKNYSKDIKKMCWKNSSEFKWVSFVWKNLFKIKPKFYNTKNFAANASRILKLIWLVALFLLILVD